MSTSTGESTPTAELASAASSPTLGTKVEKGTTTTNGPRDAVEQGKKSHARKGSAKSSTSSAGRSGTAGGGGRSSGGRNAAISAAGPLAAPGTSAPAVKSAGLANLKSLISDMSAPVAPPMAPSTSTSSSRDRRNRKAAGSSGAPHVSAAAPTPTIVVPPAALNASTTVLGNNLNPHAGGFQPGQLSAISDMVNEGLVTPTASHFDMMTGRMNSPGRPVIGGGAAGLVQTAPGFAFPQSGPSHAQQQQQLQHQQLQARQQQQILMLQQQHQQQLYQMAPMQYLNSDPASLAISQMQAQQYAQQQQQIQHQQQQQQIQQQQLQQRFVPQVEHPSDLMLEQQSIQQQLEVLRLQQESLLSRFTEMQIAANNPGIANVSSPSSAAPSPRPTHQAQQSSLSGPSAGHRRAISQSSSGAMGSFTFGQGRIPGLNSTAPAADDRPKPFTFPPHLAGGGPGEVEFSGSARNSITGESGRDRGFGHARRESAQGSISSLNGWSMNNQGSSQTQLAEASLHLSQLAAYRASSGHSRVPSFGMSSNSNSGPLAMAGYGGSIQPQTHNNNGGGQQRKPLFAPYLPQNSISPLVRAGKLVIGTLRVNKKNRSDAYITAEGLESDIYVCGSKDRNRALEGDVVAIELLDVDEVWGTKKGKEEKKRKKEEATPGAASPAAIRNAKMDLKKKDDVEVEGQGMLLLDEEEISDEQKPAYAGHVVAVVERSAGQLFSGMLGVLRPSSAATQQKQENERRERDGGNERGHHYHTPQQAPKIIWFRPTDKRVPLIAIPTDQAPADFIDQPDKYSNRLFIACIKRWPITSLHPFGTLVEELGAVGDIEAETQAILKDCNFSSDDFTESVLKCLPAVPWSISESEQAPEVRRDFRDNRVFTIDPETAKDLDDALHIVDNEDGTFEVGVHIADVTHFVKPNSALDREARKRATTVYLVQRAIPMLPKLLSEELCSLTAGLDKLTFSVVFKMTADGKIVETWFGKSIINSAVKLAYSDAQEVIEGRPLPELKIVAKDGRAGVEKDILMMASLARQIRARRFETGALRIDNAKVSFGLDENGMPNDATTFIRKEANELIEEFMLSANIAVAGKIASGFPEQALLRNHAPPIDKRLTAFIERMGRIDIALDGATAGSLMDSIQHITDPNARFTLTHLATKSMQRAKYFCTGSLDISKFQHYALNVPLYTHFTSPIRRYADIIVHRQLEAILTGNSAEMKSIHDTESVTKIATVCNIKKDAAKLAQEQSAHLFLCILIADLTTRYGPVIRDATVIGVLDSAFDVLIPEFGIEKRVHVDQMPIIKHAHDEPSNCLKIFWKQGVNVLSWLAERDSHDLNLRRIASDTPSSLAPSDDQVGRKISPQHRKSQDKSPKVFEETEITAAGEHIQKIRELQTVPVVVTADMTKSPPVIKVVSLNPFV